MGLQNQKIAALSFVTADLNYLAPPLGRPRTYTFEPPSGEPKSNIVPEPHSPFMTFVRSAIPYRSTVRGLPWFGKTVR